MTPKILGTVAIRTFIQRHCQTLSKNKIKNKPDPYNLEKLLIDRLKTPTDPTIGGNIMNTKIKSYSDLLKQIEQFTSESRT